MKKRSIYISALVAVAIMVSLNVCAKDRTTIILKNGSRLTGMIVGQRIGKDVNIDIEKAEYVFNPSKASITKKDVRYENLSREWQRWSIQNKALVGNGYGRSITLYQVRIDDAFYDNLKRIEKDTTPKIVYLQLNSGISTVNWSDISEIQKEHDYSSAIDDEIETHDGKVYRGHIVAQLFEKSINIQTATTLVSVPVSDIRETRKVGFDESRPLMEQVDYFNSIVLVTGEVKEGVIFVNHYSTKANDKYIKIHKADGQTEKIAMSMISEIKTICTETEKEDYYEEGEVYINEFKIKPAKTITEKEVTAYVDRSVFPFPEGIVTTFKSKGSYFCGNWKLMVLESVKLSDGKSTQGYNETMLSTNLVNPSRTESVGEMSILSFTYLAPGFYALINQDSKDTYIFKIVK